MIILIILTVIWVLYFINMATSVEPQDNSQLSYLAAVEFYKTMFKLIGIGIVVLLILLNNK